MKTLLRRIAVFGALTGGALLMPVTACAQEVTPPPPAPPAPPLPPGFKPFEIKTLPTFPTPPGPAVVPAAPAPVATPIQISPQQYGPLTNFIWDAEQKEITARPGDSNVHFTFWFTNTSPTEVTINAVRTSCGCTVVKLPATPWRIPPGTNGPIEVDVDLRGKQGTIAKSVSVESTAGTKALIVKINIPVIGQTSSGFAVAHPQMSDADRLANMQASLKDRQVVFKDAKCATCHADPAKGVVDGAMIYRGVCASCHDSPLRAAAVTDLKSLKHETDIDYWKHWIANGKEGSMMPAYALAHGGPLNDQQINALAAYCLNTFKPVTAVKAPAPPPATTTNAAVTPSSISIFPLPAGK